MLDLVGNPEDRFSHNEPHISVIANSIASGERPRSGAILGLYLCSENEGAADLYCWFCI